MVPKTIDIATIKDFKDSLLSLIEQDSEIILTDSDTLLVKLTPIKKPTLPTGQRVPGLHPGHWMSDDFDKPL